MKQYKILYVDDEQTNLRVFNSIFRRYYQVFTAASGEEGLEILRQERVQVIITDQRMPRMTGLEFLEKAIQIAPDALRLVLTAYSDVDTTIKAINDYGIYRYLVKPWTKDEMRLTLDRALEAWQLKQDKQALLQELQEINLHLEQKVKERTQNLLTTNDALRQAKTQLEANHQGQERLFSTVSHEMRNALQIIAQSVNLLKDDIQHPQLDALEFASQNLLQLTNDLLDGAKIKAGKLQLEQIRFSPLRVLEQIKETWQTVAQRKGIQLALEVPTALPDQVLGDPLRLNQIITNLVSNAIKFTEKGGITIRAQQEQQQWLRVSVRDTGIGIAPERLPYIFDPYTQAEQSTSRKYGGTGLGLSITQNLVSLQGGKIGVESQPQQGTSFWFELPLLLPKSMDGTRILLVDDDPINRMIGEKILDRWNVHWTSAQNGEEALHYLQQQDFDLVLMDLQMPVMDGRTAIQRIRQLPKHQHLPVLALTGEDPEDDLQQLGFTDYLLKPYDAQTLRGRIEKHLAPTHKTLAPSHVLDLDTLRYIADGDEDFLREQLMALHQTLKARHKPDYLLLFGQHPDRLPTLERALEQLEELLNTRPRS
ncbi:MAG: response regulator [Bernardetiaceae bacterium]